MMNRHFHLIERSARFVNPHDANLNDAPQIRCLHLVRISRPSGASFFYDMSNARCARALEMLDDEMVALRLMLYGEHLAP